MLHNLIIAKDTAAPNPTTRGDYPLRFWHKTPELESTLPISEEITPASGIAHITPLYRADRTLQTSPHAHRQAPAAYAFITHATTRTLNLGNGTTLEDTLEDALEELNAHLQFEVYSVSVDDAADRTMLALTGITSTAGRHLTDRVPALLQQHGLLPSEPDDDAFEAIERAFFNGSAPINLLNNADAVARA